jgi:tetratricopeptide (TPR) repeat protein
MADLSLGEPQGSVPDLVLSEDGELRSKAMAHYAMALQLETAGKIREALVHYREVIKSDPQNADLVAHTADMAMGYGSEDEALNLLKESVERNPGSAKPYLHLANFLSTYGGNDPKTAAEIANVIAEAQAKFPQNAEVYQTTVMLHLTKNSREKATEVMKKALTQNVSDPEFWLTLGRLAQEVWPLGQTESQTQNRERVNPYFERAQQTAGSGPSSDAIQLQVAQFYLLTNQLPAAKKICASLAAKPGNPQARKMLYRLHEAAGENDQAYETMKAIVKDAPGDPEQRKLLAALCEQRKEYAEAALHMEAAIQSSGGDSEAYEALSQLLLRSEQYEKLIQLSQRGIRLFPDRVLFHVFAGIAHRMMKQWEKAISYFAAADAQAQASAPDQLNYRFYFQYGVTLERAGRFEESAKQFEKSIETTPKESVEEAANTMNYLGYMWLDQNRNLDKAEELIRKANEIEPGNGAYIDSLGWLHFKKGDFKAALTELLRARELIDELKSEDAEIIDHIGQTYLKLGDKNKGIEHLRQAHKLDPTNASIKQRLDEAEGKSTPAAAPKLEDTAPPPVKAPAK